MGTLKRIMGKIFATSFHWLKQRYTKKYEEICSKIKGLIESITNNSEHYGENYMKIKFNDNDDDDSHLKKTLKVYIVLTDVKSIFNEENNYNNQLSNRC